MINRGLTGVAGVILFIVGLFAGIQIQPTNDLPMPVKVLTADGQDLDIVVNPNGTVNNSRAVAPLMTEVWLNLDIMERKPMQWCLVNLPADTAAVARDLLSILYSHYGLTWTEGCPSTYLITDLAQLECGIGDGAVACATYGGQRGGKISYNGNRYRSGSCTVGCVRAGLAHELGHIFRLDHTPCNNPQPSSMSPIYLPDGPACASQGRPDFSWEDWGLAEEYYKLSAVGRPPLPTVDVKLQRWIEYRREPCAAPSGDFCIETGKEVRPPTANRPWYTIVKDTNGQLEFLTPFVEVGDR